MTVQLLDDGLLDEVLEKAAASPRRRTNHNFHAGPEAHAQRLLNVMLEGTYVAPHRHLHPPKSEAFLVLRGAVTVLLFDDEGRIEERHELRADGSGPFGIDLPPGVWHTLVVRSASAVVYEVKTGPYDPSDDKEFAPWAPREGDPEASAAQHAWLSARP